MQPPIDQQQQQPTSALMGLPNELLLYILKQFLEIGDLWQLLQVSRSFRYLATYTIDMRWRMDLSKPESFMKVQCRAALVALETLSCQLSTQTRVTPFAYQTSYLSASTTTTTTNNNNNNNNPAAAAAAAAASSVSASSGMPDPAASAASAAAGLLDQRRPSSARSMSPYYDDEEDELSEEDELHPQRLLLLDSGSGDGANGSSSSSSSNHPHHEEEDDEDEDEDEDEEDGEEEEEEGHQEQPPPHHSSPHLHHHYHYHHPQQGDSNNSSSNSKLFHHLMRREERLHQRIVSGISSYKHKYVLIEDIDIRNRIRSAVDVIFHHAVFVTSVSRSPVRLACTHASSNNRALAAMMVRLLTRLDVAFPACCREITFTLADNIKAFLEYTGYKLMFLSKSNKSMTQQQGDVLYSMVFGPACQSAALCNSSTTTTTATAIDGTGNDSRSRHQQQQHHHLSLPRSTSSSSHSSSSSLPPVPSRLLDTLHSISACFDLMGAAFIGKILSENHVECAVQRACELLSDSYLRPVKRALLVDLLEGWLTIKRGLVASELCRWVRTEIERCDQQASSSSSSSSSSFSSFSSTSSSATAATTTTTAMRATSSFHPPLSDLVSLAHLPMS
ncbi:hypothetical protein BDB00DRAFT_832826 [Zychaea mexicana]|uniref:uncharacterized protein n=1 Tax=Zychaea mexicana TaxID=64656 RepID=UPI0022FF1D47|nr:uncharacterized protein BDB00DRAFT_832826 [Zychaea mexicana]KAI9491396.1 hypothetical protein BDB00DRAFT_832826 [Zychaea mexicana]